jgi:hypothetical protein
MSLVVFPQKFTKGHLIASFQSDNIKTRSIYKSTLISPFQYDPQTNCLLVAAAAKEMNKEPNEITGAWLRRTESKSLL